jgi:hypothetical protein
MAEIIHRRVRGTTAALAALVLGASGAYAFTSSNDAPVPGQPVFALSDDFPADLEAARQGESAPWEVFDFKTTDGARRYLLAVLRYVVEGNERVFALTEGAPDRPWQPEVRGKTRWFHVPWMHTGTFGRESIHGMTRERALSLQEVLLQELRPAQDTRFQTWAVGFYNPLGGYTLGRVWPNENGVPQPSEAMFPNGTVVAKLLFANASPDDIPYLQGAPIWHANIHHEAELFHDRWDDPTYTKKGCWLWRDQEIPQEAFDAACKRERQPMRLVQLDVGVKDSDAIPTGWVFGTFVFNGDRSPEAAGAIVPGERLVAGTSPWNQLEPVGLMWGNDPGVGTAERVEETLRIRDEGVSQPQHLGCRNRLNGPVDNPAASCLACHALARFPAPDPDNFSMNFPPCGGETRDRDGRLTALSIAYFRNLPGDQPIDDLRGLTLPGIEQLNEVENPELIRGLDYSLQLSFGMTNFCFYWRDRPTERSAEITEFCHLEQPVVADQPETPAPPASAVEVGSLLKHMNVTLHRQSR